MRFILRLVYLRGRTFRALNGPDIFYITKFSTHAARTHASAAAGMHARTGLHEPAACMRCMHAAAAACMNRQA